MKQSTNPRRGRPKLVKAEGERLERKDVLLPVWMIGEIEAKARETSQNDGKPPSFSGALRDMVGYYLERVGRKGGV